MATSRMFWADVRGGHIDQGTQRRGDAVTGAPRPIVRSEGGLVQDHTDGWCLGKKSKNAPKQVHLTSCGIVVAI